MHAKSFQLCPTLCDLWTGACQAPLSMDGILQAILENSPRSPPLGDLPYSGIKLTAPASPALAGELFTASPTWEAH